MFKLYKLSIKPFCLKSFAQSDFKLGFLKLENQTLALKLSVVFEFKVGVEGGLRQRSTMIPPHNSLVKYDNPVLVSTSKDKKGKGKDKGKGGKKLAPLDSKPQLTQTSLSNYQVVTGNSGAMQRYY